MKNNYQYNLQGRKNSMKRQMILTGLVAAALILWLAAPSTASEITIKGEVTEELQIVTTDGDVYDVYDSEKGEDLLSHVGEKVEVKGTLVEEDGSKSISVIEFKILDE
jgi:hypothetical protein